MKKARQKGKVLAGQYARLRLRQVVPGLMAACALLLPGAGRAQGTGDNPQYGKPRGPLSIRDSRPYNLLFLQFMPESGDVLPARANAYGLQLDVINNLLIPAPDRLANGTNGAVIREDNEYQRLAFAWRRGLGKQTELAVYAPLVWRNGGLLDGILSGYHRLVGLPGNSIDDPNGRDFGRKYQSVLQIVDASGQTRVNQGNAFGVGEINITLKRGLTPQTARASLAARLGVKIPVGNPTLLLGSGAFDVGLSLDARYSLGRDIIVYANVGGVLMGRAESHVRALNPAANMAQTLAALEYRANNRDSFVLQLDGNTRAVRTGNRLADGWQAHSHVRLSARTGSASPAAAVIFRKRRPAQLPSARLQQHRAGHHFFRRSEVAIGFR